MFGALKDKLKSWIKKNEEPVEIIEEKPKKTAKKKETKKIEKKAKKRFEEKKSVQKKPKIKVSQEKIEEGIIEVTSEPLAEEKVEEKKSFFSLFRKEKKPEEADSAGEPEEKKSEEKKSFLSTFQKKLTPEKFEEIFEELELILLQNNVAYETKEAIKKSLEEKLIGKSLKEVDLAKELKYSIESILVNPPNFIETIRNSIKEKSPYVIIFAGINGAGKTTAIAKVTHYLQKNKLSVCLAAADTFRAASIEQLQQHADKLKVHMTKKDYGSDPASVSFDAIAYAKKHKIDVVLIDTAGRLQNKESLMKEIEKITRVNKPDMKIFLGESITGNDATEQAKAFNETINIDGIILSKADVDEKGGTAISVSQITGKPILFLGTGQGYDDLEVFDKKKLIEKLGL